MTKALAITVFYFLLTVSFNQEKTSALQNGQIPRLIDYSKSKCEFDKHPNQSIIQERIVKQIYSGDTLELWVITKMNCCSGEKGYISITNDTLNLYSDFADPTPVLNSKEDTIDWSEVEICDCTCIHNLKYVIVGINDSILISTINGQVIELLPNKYTIPTHTIYKGDTLFSHDNEGYVYSYKFDEDCILRLMKKEKAPHYFWTEFYSNGAIKSEMEFYLDLDHSKVTEYDKFGNITFFQNNLDY